MPDIQRPGWVTQADITKAAELAADDVRRAAGGVVDINPFSTVGVRAEWRLGYELKPHGHHGVHIAGPLSWSAIWERGVQARLLLDKEKDDGKTLTA